MPHQHTQTKQQESGRPAASAAPKAPAEKAKGKTPAIGRILLGVICLSMICLFHAVRTGKLDQAIFRHRDGVRTVQERTPAANDAMDQLTKGYAYYLGMGVPQDPATAFSHFHKAADAGNALGQFQVGSMYAQGEGVAMDMDKAFFWFLKSAEQGYASAQFNLGILYATGQGTPQDKTQAAQWFRKAAGQGVAEAQYELAVLYDTGQGVPRDKTQAAEWFRQAAEHGHAGAALEAAARYADGEGVTKDAVRAYTYLVLHAALRNEEMPTAEEDRLKAALERQLTPEQKAEAQRKAAALGK